MSRSAPRTGHVALLIGAALATAAPAQQGWLLPTGGAARYVAIERFAPEPDGELPGCLLPHATLLLHSELAAGGSHVAIDAQDWRWIAPLLAFDLRLQPGKITTRLARVPHLGDLDVRGEATSDGDQLRLQLDLRVVANRDDGFAGSGTGKLELTRRVADGVVAEFAAQLTLQMQFGPRLGARALHGTFAQDWHLDRVVPHREPGFTKAVGEAIVRGADPIRHALRPERDEFATRPAGKDHPCGEGRLALGIQTLLTAGLPPTDPVIVAALDELRRRRIVETYSLATSILAFDALYAPPGERDALRSGALTAPVPRQIAAADTGLLAEWTTRLRNNRDSSTAGARVARWTYLGGQQFDNSNSQYALLGLWQAQWCGSTTPISVWQAAANHWLAAQHRADGPARALRCIDARTFAEHGLQAASRGGSASTAAPRGFGYKAANDGPAYGSMTAAGVTGLGLCREVLTAGGAKAPAKLDNALRAGLAWLSRERSVRWNPGPVTQRHEFFFYWLYSLERACQLNHVVLLDDWDWYHDGAQVLLALQDADGAFGPATFEEQCFAVLFLGRAQLAARTGGLDDDR